MRAGTDCLTKRRCHLLWEKFKRPAIKLCKKHVTWFFKCNYTLDISLHKNNKHYCRFNSLIELKGSSCSFELLYQLWFSQSRIYHHLLISPPPSVEISKILSSFCCSTCWLSPDCFHSHSSICALLVEKHLDLFQAVLKEKLNNHLADSWITYLKCDHISFWNTDCG